MTTCNYLVGQSGRVWGTFTDVAGVLIDPAQVFFHYEVPAGTKTELEYLVDPEVVRQSLGVFYVDLAFNAEGVWKTAFRDGTGTGYDQLRLIVAAADLP